MYSRQDSEWLDARIRERAENLKQRRLANRDPNIPVIDASKFSQPLSDLAIALTHKVEREGPGTMGLSSVPVDISIILRQLNQTYNLIRFINADDTRFGLVGYHQPYSFVSLPLVRTMIDGLYNCTALLYVPSRAHTFRISGYFRIREAIRTDEAKYAHDPAWKVSLDMARANLQQGMRADGFTDADLDDRVNEWPLLGKYLGTKPDTPHRQMLRKLTLGFWKEYSSISHASYDGLINIFPMIATDRLQHENRPTVDEAVDRHIAMHFGRAAGVLLCLLTEIQHYFRFDGAHIDKRLGELWGALIPMLEVRELYDFRFRSLLKEPPDISP